MSRIGLDLYTPYLDKPISASREEAEKKLLEKNKGSDKKLVCVDGSNFTDNIKTIGDQEIIGINSALLLPAGFDGVIANTKKKVELALPVGDCGLLTAYHKTGSGEYDILGNAHLGYKGVIADGDLEKNGIIENFLNSLMQEANTKNLDDFEFFLAPMAGENFELPRKYFFEKIAPFIEKQNKDISENYKLSVEDFIKNSDNTYKDGEERVYFDLRKLILYVLRNKHGVIIPENNIYLGDTTDPKNILSSFRSHSLAKNIPERVYDEKNLIPNSFINMVLGVKKYSDITSDDIKDLMQHYQINKEQAELILHGNAEHYKKINSRLSLNIFKK